MRVAVEVWGADFTRVRRACEHAEDLGLDGFYYGESPTDLTLECWTTIAALATATERIRLGPVIANVLPAYRSTSLLVRQARAVDRISGGRLDFRTGAGADRRYGKAWWEPAGVHYPPYAQRLTDLGQALGQLRRARVDRAPIPITVAATGERAMRLAAEHADVWETSFCTVAEFSARAAAMACLLDGRPIVRSLEIDGFLSPTERGLRSLLDRVRRERGAEDLDAIFERALVGTPGHAADRLAALAEAGVDQVVVALHDPLDPEALETLATAADGAVASPPGSDRNIE